MFSTRTSPSKWVTEPALEAGTSVASPMTKMFGRTFDCSVCGSVGHEAELVAEARGPVHVLGATVHRDDDGQVERHLAFVVADQAATDTVDLAGVELGDQVDALLLEHPATASPMRSAW